MRNRRFFRPRILPAVLLGALSALAPSSAAGPRTFPNEISAAVGLAHFGPADDKPGAVAYQGALRFDRYLRDDVFLGMLADLALAYCLICDQPHRDVYLGTVALVGGMRFGTQPYVLQLGAGIGIADVENGYLRVGDQGIGSNTTVDVPFLAKAGYMRDFAGLGFGLGIGLEAKYHLNAREPAFVLALPLTVAY